MKCSHSITLKRGRLIFLSSNLHTFTKKVKKQILKDIVYIMACEVIVVQKSSFTEKLGFWGKMAKIWHKVQENGTTKIRLAKLVAKEKKNLAQTLP